MAQEPMQSQSGYSDVKRLTLEEATKAICGDRNKTYGDVSDNFNMIAGLANILFKAKLSGRLTGSDVARFMVLLKLARSINSPDHFDNWVDMAGYAACGAECKDEPQHRMIEDPFEECMQPPAWYQEGAPSRPQADRGLPETAKSPDRTDLDD